MEVKKSLEREQGDTNCSKLVNDGCEKNTNLLKDMYHCMEWRMENFCPGSSRECNVCNVSPHSARVHYFHSLIYTLEDLQYIYSTIIAEVSSGISS